jgi:hypothetical protein
VDINLLEAAQAIAAALSLLRLWRKQTTLKSVPRKYPALSQDISHLSLALSWKKKTSSLKKVAWELDSPTAQHKFKI